MGSDFLIPTITNLFISYIGDRRNPNIMETENHHFSAKKGPKDDINNYRPINLLSNLYKLFMQIITKRMSKILDENQPVEQAGFRSQFCTIEHLQATNQLIEKVLEFNLRLYIAFEIGRASCRERV